MIVECVTPRQKFVFSWLLVVWFAECLGVAKGADGPGEEKIFL